MWIMYSISKLQQQLLKIYLIFTIYRNSGLSTNYYLVWSPGIAPGHEICHTDLFLQSMCWALINHNGLDIDIKKNQWDSFSDPTGRKPMLIDLYLHKNYIYKPIFLHIKKNQWDSFSDPTGRKPMWFDLYLHKKYINKPIYLHIKKNQWDSFSDPTGRKPMWFDLYLHKNYIYKPLYSCKIVEKYHYKIKFTIQMYKSIDPQCFYIL